MWRRYSQRGQSCEKKPAKMMNEPTRLKNVKKREKKKYARKMYAK